MAMWSDDEQHDSRIDAAIDEVAREMTDGAPDSSFKARVLARIDDHRPRRGRLVWMLSPLVVAALVIVAVIVFRQSERQSQPAPNATRSDNRAKTVDAARDREPANDATTATRPGETVARQTPAPAQSAASRRPPRAAIASTTSGEFEALAPPPLAVESIRLAALPAANSIRVAPLETIAPIDVAPLGEPEDDRVPQPEGRDESARRAEGEAWQARGGGAPRASQ
jgi:hypothetical protein